MSKYYRFVVFDTIDPGEISALFRFHSADEFLAAKQSCYSVARMWSDDVIVTDDAEVLVDMRPDFEGYEQDLASIDKMIAFLEGEDIEDS